MIALASFLSYFSASYAYPASLANCHCSHLEANDTPVGDQLSHIHEISDQATTDATTERTSLTAATPMYLGGGLPPIPAKLRRRIEDGHFIQMAELMPDHLELLNSSEDDLPRTRHKHQDLTNILDWVQCFSTYVAVIAQATPQHVSDRIAYMNLVVNGHRRFQDFDWASYDRQFRLKAAASPIPQWSTMEGTLWNLSRSSQPVTQSSRPATSQTPSGPRKTPICLEWNENPSAGCPHIGCRYDHVCYRCVHNPSIKENNHKAIRCPNKGKKTPKSSQ